MSCKCGPSRKRRAIFALFDLVDCCPERADFAGNPAAIERPFSGYRVQCLISQANAFVADISWSLVFRSTDEPTGFFLGGSAKRATELIQFGLRSHAVLAFGGFNRLLCVLSQDPVAREQTFIADADCGRSPRGKNQVPNFALRLAAKRTVNCVIHKRGLFHR